VHKRHSYEYTQTQISARLPPKKTVTHGAAAEGTVLQTRDRETFIIIIDTPVILQYSTQILTQRIFYLHRAFTLDL
jgi:hypothetical protein